MPEFDWRSPETYRPIQDVNAAGFAWEFLRRNPDYRRDVRKRSDKLPATSTRADAQARHWGLPFRDGSTSISRRNTGVLAPDRNAFRSPRHPLPGIVLGRAAA